MVSGGPWGFWDAPILLSPIVFLVIMVLKPRPMPAARSLWKAANIMFFIKVIYLKASPIEAFSCFVSGVLQALTPISIMSGAITLLDCMESSQCLTWIKVQLRNITNCHPVAEVMLVGFCFSFMCEGGGIRPVVLAVPMLYSMGHPKLESVVCVLLFNAFQCIFGAAGIPVWFGVGKAVPEYAEADLLRVGFNAAVALAVCAHLLVPYIVSIVVPMDELKPSWRFVLLSTCSVTVPFVAMSWVNYEFPSAAAGLIGVSITAALTIFGIGLGPHKRTHGLEALEDLENPSFNSDSGKEGEAASPGPEFKSVRIDEEVASPGPAELQGESKDNKEGQPSMPGQKSVSFGADTLEDLDNLAEMKKKNSKASKSSRKSITFDPATKMKDDDEASWPTASTTATPQSTTAAGRMAMLRSFSNLSQSKSNEKQLQKSSDCKEDTVTESEEVAMHAVESVTFDVDTCEVKSVILENGEKMTDLSNVDLETLIRAKTYTSLDEAEFMHRPGSTKANVGRATFRSFSNLSRQGTGRYQSQRSSRHGRSSYHSSAYSRASSRAGISRAGSMASLKSRAVNTDVQLTKKDIKVLTKRDGMDVPPAEVMRCLDDDDDAPAAVRMQIDDEDAEEYNVVPTVSEIILRTLPLWLTFLLLILTRIEPIGLKSLLREDKPRLVDGDVGNLGHLIVSTAGHISLSQITGTTLSWTYELFYTPAIMPFYIAGWASLLVFRKELTVPPVQLMRGVFHRIRGPAVALSGALVLAELMRTRDDDPAGKDAPAVIIGLRLAEVLGDGWVILSFPLGALGTFFSGTTTVSMLTFSQVQRVAADSLGLSSQALMALQLCGAAAGGCLCLTSIISAKAVVGLHVPEDVLVKKMVLPVFAMYIICTAVLLPFVYV